MNELTISVWQAIIATTGGVALAVAVPLFAAFLAFRPWIQSTVKAEMSEFRTEVARDLAELRTKLERLGSIGGALEEQVHEALKDKPNPPVTRKNELLDRWHNRVLTYEESVELRTILEQESKQADDNLKAIIGIAIIALALYILSQNK